MFFSVLLGVVIMVYWYLWGDYMKVLILLEVLSLIFIYFILNLLKLDYLSLNYFFSILVFLVCESSLGFLLFILYISMEYEVVGKMNLVQF